MIGMKWSQLQGGIRHPTSIPARSAVTPKLGESPASAVVAQELGYINICITAGVRPRGISQAAGRTLKATCAAAPTATLVNSSGDNSDADRIAESVIYN